MSRSVFRTSHIEVDVLPIVVCLFRYQRLIVVRVHIAQVVGTGAGKARHGVQFKREYGHVVYLRIFHHFAFFYIPCPFRSVSQRRFTGFGRQELGYFGQFQRELAFVYHVRHSVFVIYGERFAPIALA